MLKPSTLSVDLTKRTVTQSRPCSLQDSVAVTLAATGASVNTNIKLLLVRKSVICAIANTFTGGVNAFTAQLSLDTSEMMDVFDGARPYAHRRFDLFIYDASQTGFLVKNAVNVENSELRDTDAYPSNVSPVEVSTTIWGKLRVVAGVMYVYSVTDGKWYPFTGEGAGEQVHLDIDGTGGINP